MKTTLLRTKVDGLQGLIDRRVEPELVKKEIREIFSMLETVDKEDKEYALKKLIGLTMFLATEVGIDDSIGKFFAQMEGIRTNINTNTNKKSKLKVVEVHVNINEFRDATEIKVDTKVPMSELKMIITKARQDILDNVREIRYSEKGEMWIGHKKGSKDVVINIEGWKMSESENLIFIENFLEYITE